MTVKTLEKKYSLLQKEGNEIYAEIKPLLVKLVSLSLRCNNLAQKVDADKALYKEEMRTLFDGRKEKSSIPDGWNFDLFFRLEDMGDTCALAHEIKNALLNLKGTPFREKRNKRVRG